MVCHHVVYICPDTFEKNVKCFVVGLFLALKGSSVCVVRTLKKKKKIPEFHLIWWKCAATQDFLIILYTTLGKKYTAKVRMTQHCLGVKVKGPVRRQRTRDHQRKNRRGEKIDRCQEGAGLGVTRKMGLIPPPIPAAFLLFEVNIWAKFPLLTWAKRKSSGWVEGGSGPLLPPRLNCTNTVAPRVAKAGTEQTYTQTLIQCSSWWIRDDYWNGTDVLAVTRRYVWAR